MLAAIFHKPGEKLRIETRPDPEPGTGEVVLRVHRCGICGTDLHLTEEGSFLAPPGFIAGHERGAEVIAVGKGVEVLKVGDNVVPHSMRGCGVCAECKSGSPYFCRSTQMNMGGFAQYMAAPEIACAKLPASLSLADAALVEPLAVGMLGVQINPFPIGSKVVVLGSGPIGLAAAFWARRAGAGRVVSVARSQQREPLALAIGADAFFVTSDTLGEELRSYLGGPADTVIECAGVPGSIQRAVEIVKPRGSVTVLGLCTHSDPWVPALALTKEIRIQFAVGTTIRQFEDVADFLSAGHLEASAMVTDTVSLDALPDAFEALRNRTTQCKVMVDPWAGL